MNIADLSKRKFDNAGNSNFTDEKGNKTSVIVAYKDWLKLNKQVADLRNKLDVVTSIQTGIKEVKTARKSGRKLQTLSDFINSDLSDSF